jgi:hypothetical protein
VDAAGVLADFDADEGALEGHGGAVPIDLGVVGGEAFLGAGEGFVGALDVDFFGALGGFGEDGDAVGEDFGKSAEDGEEEGFAARGRAVTQFTVAQLGDERGVARENAEFAAGAGKLHTGNFFAEQLALRGDDDEFDGFGQHLRFPVKISRQNTWLRALQESNFFKKSISKRRRLKGVHFFKQIVLYKRAYFENPRSQQRSFSKTL